MVIIIQLEEASFFADDSNLIQYDMMNEYFE